MGEILSAYLFPHPPIIMEEIGRGEEKKASKTLEGVRALSKDIKEKAPSTIIVISPHGPIFSDAITISTEERLEGDFSQFGFPKISYEFENNLDLVEKIIRASNKEGIIIAELDEYLEEEHNLSRRLDHGVLVPMYFVDKEYRDHKLIHISYGLLPPKDLYRFGMIIEEVVKETEERLVIIASGDLSHRLSKGGQYPYAVEGKVFDETIMELLDRGDMEGILNFDLALSSKAGECGLRSLMIMAGSLDSYQLKSQALSYEGPYGVGYGTARLEVVGEEKRDTFQNLKDREEERLEKTREGESEYVRLARQSLEYFVKNGKYLPVPENLSSQLMEGQKAVFVTLKMNGNLRGCIGTTEPRQKNLALEIIKNAVSAGMDDPRFPSVGEEELARIVYSVDVLYPPEPISSKEELDIENYGLIVSKDYRKGLLLPNIDGIHSVEEQISVSLSKAGIRPHEDYKMERFKVERHN